MHQTFTWGPLVEADCGYGEAGTYKCAENSSSVTLKRNWGLSLFLKGSFITTSYFPKLLCCYYL